MPTYDRKDVPFEFRLGAMHQQGRSIWNQSKGRRFDTFVGVTHIATAQSFIYPVFIRPTKTADEVISRARSTINPGQYARVALSGVTETYDRDAIVIDGTNAALVGDGFAHMQAVERAAKAAALGNPSPDQFIGWALMGGNNPGEKFIIRFSSGLNNRYQTFSPRQPKAGESTAAFEARIAASNKESRDLPKAWRESILDMLTHDLGLDVELHSRVDVTDRSGAPKRTAVAMVKVKRPE
jgi:hypothetical protein